MKSHVLLFLFLCMFVVHPSAGQKKEKYTAKAAASYERLGYSEAIEMYQKGEITLEVIERIANSYRLKGDSWNASRWYSLLVGQSPNPLHLLYYAQALQSNGEQEKAKPYFQRYYLLLGNQRRNDPRGNLSATAIESMQTYQGPAEIQVRNERLINSERLDFSPAFYQNSIVFVSNREASQQGADAWTGGNFTSLYISAAGNNGLSSSPEQFPLDPGFRYHEGPATFSQNGQLGFFTKNKEVKMKNKGQKSEWVLKIYTTSHTGETWTSPTLLDLASETSNDAHPSLSHDGMRLFFSSDRPGGYGGMDLYVVAFKGGRWSYPVNLGPGINTAGNEVFPFISPEGDLYFASDGWGGLGGLDIFYAPGTQGEIYFPESINLGAPINSNKDDFGFILSPSCREGYFSSAREGGVGLDDIYFFSMPRPNLHKEVIRPVPNDVLQGFMEPGPENTVAPAMQTGTSQN